MLSVPLLPPGAGVVGVSLVFLLFSLFFIVLVLLTTAVSIYVVYWTYKDAQRRGMDSPELWAVIVFFASIPGLILYLLVRE